MSTYYNSPALAPIRPFHYPYMPRDDQHSVSDDAERLEQRDSAPVAGSTSGSTEGALAEAFARGKQAGRLEVEQQTREQAASASAIERARITQTVDDFRESASDYFGKIEADVVQLALGIAAKILHREARVDRMLVAALVKVAVLNIKDGSHITVRIRPEEGPAWRLFFGCDDSLQLQFEVIDDPSLEEGQCVVQTVVGTADFGIDAQLKEVEHGLFDLLAQRPGR